MKIPFIKPESRWSKAARLLHLTNPQSPAEKIINTLLHLLLYISLIFVGYLLALLQFAE